MRHNAKIEASGARGSPTFERSWFWPVLAVLAVGPFIAFSELGIKPVTATGWLALMSAGPLLLAVVMLCDRLLTWLGRLDALGSLETRRWRLFATTAAAVGAIAAIAGVVISSSGSSASITAVRLFLAHNFTWGV